MITKEKFLALGEMIRQEYIKLALNDYKISSLMGPMFIENLEKVIIEQINNHTKQIKDTILPCYDLSNIILYEKGRATRSLETEHKRLWARAVKLYTEENIRSLPERVCNSIKDPDSGIDRKQFEGLVENQLLQSIVPALASHRNSGENFYIYVHELIRYPEEQITIEAISDTGRTPLEIGSTFYGIFGLLLQAENAIKSGESAKAYSLLIDATHMIGMHEGARYTTVRMDAVAAKRRAKYNAKKKHSKTDPIKARAHDLFYELMPFDKKMQTKRWETATQAFNRVWDQLVAEANNKQKDPGVADSTIKNICQHLQRTAKNGGWSDIRVQVIQASGDTENAD